jgi:hypothetical protein
MTPKNFTHFHQIAILFQLFAVKTDGEFTIEEKHKIKDLLSEWIGDKDTTLTVLKESASFLASYDKDHSDKISELLTFSANEIINAGIFSESNLKSILADLQDIAFSDSEEISDNEETFIVYLAEIWGIEL